MLKLAYRKIKEAFTLYPNHAKQFYIKIEIYIFGKPDETIKS